jgi:hypothetical protein
VQATLIDRGDLKRLYRRLGELEDGRELRRDLRAGLRGVLTPTRDRLKAAYRGQAGYGGTRTRPGPPLRYLLASATRVEVRTSGREAGARLRVDGRKMPSGMRSLPAYREGYKPRWRWPVYGNRNVWAQGQPHPTFDAIVAVTVDPARREVEQILDGIRRQLERE